MKKILFAIAFLLVAGTSDAQSDTSAEDVVFHSVQVEAYFPGGIGAWRKYLEQNLNVDLADSCLIIPKGQKSVRQTVVVSFRVGKDGKITDVVADNYKDVHPLLAAESVRVIKNGPNWVPAQQDGKRVIYRQRQSITWVVTEE